MGAQSGLIVIAVQPDSAAGRGGMREGDVIELIDGHVIRGPLKTFTLTFSPQKKHTLAIVRDREKKQIVLETND